MCESKPSKRGGRGKKPKKNRFLTVCQGEVWRLLIQAGPGGSLSSSGGPGVLRGAQCDCRGA